MFEPLTKIIAYTFTFMIVAVGICFGLVLYIHQLPQETQVVTQPIDIVVKPELTEQQQQGKQLFKANCASCHKMNKRAVGPALAGVTNKYEKEWLYSWIKNSQAMIASGDPEAVRVYKEYKETAMNSFPQLSNEDIDAILAYSEVY